VTQSGVYAGPGVEEIVEIDTEGRLVKFELDSDAEVHDLKLVTIVECKKAHLPWVLFSAPVSKWTHSRPLHRYSAGLGDMILGTLEFEHVTRAEPLLRVPARIGFSLRTALLKGDGPKSEEHVRSPREAKLSAEAAIHQLRRETLAWTQVHGLSDDQDPRYDGFVLFPVVVLDGELFECYQFEEKKPQIEAIDHGLLSLPAPSTELAGLPVDIVTRAAFPRFLDRLVEFSERVESALKSFVKKENERIKDEWNEVERRRGAGRRH
jgi:hypothetical protein